MIKRSITLLLISFSPLLVDSQGKSSAKEVLKDEEGFKDQFGLGVHLMPWRWFSGINPEPVIFQFSYKHFYDGFILRSGIGIGKELKEWKNDNLFQMNLMFNAGVEKGLWKLRDIYSLNLGLDFTFYLDQYSFDEGSVVNGNTLKRKSRLNIGGGLVLINQFHIDSKSGVSLEIGISSTNEFICDKYEREKDNCVNINNSFLPQYNFKYRKALLSYYYKF